MMNWEDYEEVTKYIYENLGKNNNVKVICYGNKCSVKGKSGDKHQIDVLTEHCDGIHVYKTAIECKFWDSKVQKDSVMKLASILEDAHINKGVLVAKNGFTSDAINFAKYKNIGLVELREPTDKDWENRIKDIIINMTMTIPNITIEIDMVDRENDRFSAMGEAVSIFKPDGTNETITELVKKKVEGSGWQQQDTTFISEEFPVGTYIKTPFKEDEPIAINKIKIIIEKEIVTTKTEILSQDYVYMMMKAVFEGKTFVLSKDGSIDER
jgi:predicted site-specific integrase-resolvase